MTCVLPTATWHHLDNHLLWLPMNTDTVSSESKPQSRGYVSSGSDTKKSSASSGKKRPSRAGTRSVTTLSVAQLERKRANDREAQRVIRQRTKDHIEHLEQSINELRGSRESTEKLVHVTQQRNRQLEDENAYLRNKLSEAGFTISLMPTERQRAPEPPLLSIPSSPPGAAIGASIHHPGPASTPSSHSATTQSNSQQRSWQHHSVGCVPTSSTAISLPRAPTITGGPSLTVWRSHNLGQTLQGQIQASASTFSGYQQNQPEDWPGNAASYQNYTSQEQPRQQRYETASSQQPGYQPPVQNYGACTTPQPPTYHSQLTAQNEFPRVSASSNSTAYQIHCQATFQQPGSFQVTPMQVSSCGTGYNSPRGQMQPPPAPRPSFPAGPGEQSYGARVAPSLNPVS